jgi:hypothetical protein
VPHNYRPSQQPRRFRRSLPASSRPAELLIVLPHDRGRRLQPNADTAALIDKSALGGDPPNDIFSSQYPRHFAATLTRILAMQSVVLNSCGAQGCSFCRVIPEIDIWRAANLILKRYGEKALEESEARADELAAADDYNGVAVWRRIRDAVAQLTNKTPPGRCTDPKPGNNRAPAALHPLLIATLKR